MSVLKRTEDIVVEFLRSILVDPRGRYITASESFVATALQSVFVLSPLDSSHLIRCIKCVSVNGDFVNKWQDFDIDLKGKKIILKKPVVVDSVVIVEYCCSGSGGEWIYPGFPIATMNSNKFPRVSVSVINKIGSRLGSYLSPIDSNVLFQVDVWTKEGYKPEYDSEIFTEQDLADLLAEQIENCFINDINDLYPKLYDYFGLAYGQVPFDGESQTYRHKQEFSLRGINVGH